MEKVKEFTASCPIPIQQYPKVLLAHGGGGKLMHQLIEQMFAPAFGDPARDVQHDSAVFSCDKSKIAFTTDSYVVKPLFFPGGDIGSMAVNGTVNDLAMSGARPYYLSAGFIIEEGFSMETLWQVVQSMKEAARQAGVSVITGDTKVVDKGKGDGIFINTSGVGFIEHNQEINPRMVKPGDVIIVSGDLGRHGIAIMAKREGLSFESAIESDSAPLAGLVGELIAKDVKIHCLRDLTRGGLASALNEIALTAKTGISINENSIPVREDVHGACEMLGFDPVYVACEGRFVAFVDPKDTDTALEIMNNHPSGKGACIIGEVKNQSAGIVTMKSKLGIDRIVDMISGEQLPRIC